MAHSQEKIAAVVAELLNGLTPRQVAKKHGVALQTVQRWQKNQSVSVKKKPIGDLVEEHLRLELATLSAIAEHTQNQEWLGQQSANDVAVLYGVMSDKAHAKLAALERAQREYAAQQQEAHTA